MNFMNRMSTIGGYLVYDTQGHTEFLDLRVLVYGTKLRT